MSWYVSPKKLWLASEWPPSKRVRGHPAGGFAGMPGRAGSGNRNAKSSWLHSTDTEQAPSPMQEWHALPTARASSPTAGADVSLRLSLGCQPYMVAQPACGRLVSQSSEDSGAPVPDRWREAEVEKLCNKQSCVTASALAVSNVILIHDIFHKIFSILNWCWNVTVFFYDLLYILKFILCFYM